MDHRLDLKEVKGQVIHRAACSETVAVRPQESGCRTLRLTCDCRQAVQCPETFIRELRNLRIRSLNWKASLLSIFNL